jgi:uncharacterized Tic20 family protein
MTEATPAPAAPLTEAEDKQWASFAHLGGILWILPSLIIFLVFKDRGAKTRVESKEALNWQITAAIALVALWIIVAIITAVVTAAAIASGSYGLTSVITLVGFLPGILWIVNVIFSILGFVKVNNGGSYRYPFALRLVK